ncbi:MAG: twin-arginine translocase TatA/TatE family subunit [Bdellovibrionaceae bacterium]|nr:twin-arginine translocase TatA/TatE family subunit [Pseudobdellovibrionaceae bacterium]
MGEFSLSHLLVLAVIFLIFFGPSRLPQLGQSLGKAIRGFKQGLSEIEVEAKEVKDASPSPAAHNQQPSNQQLNQNAQHQGQPGDQTQAGANAQSTDAQSKVKVENKS